MKKIKKKPLKKLRLGNPLPLKFVNHKFFFTKKLKNARNIAYKKKLNISEKKNKLLYEKENKLIPKEKNDLEYQNYEKKLDSLYEIINGKIKTRTKKGGDERNTEIEKLEKEIRTTGPTAKTLLLLEKLKKMQEMGQGIKSQTKEKKEKKTRGPNPVEEKTGLEPPTLGELQFERLSKDFLKPEEDMTIKDDGTRYTAYAVALKDGRNAVKLEVKKENRRLKQERDARREAKLRKKGEELLKMEREDYAKIHAEQEKNRLYEQDVKGLKEDEQIILKKEVKKRKFLDARISKAPLQADTRVRMAKKNEIRKELLQEKKKKNAEKAVEKEKKKDLIGYIPNKEEQMRQRFEETIPYPTFDYTIIDPKERMKTFAEAGAAGAQEVEAAVKKEKIQNGKDTTKSRSLRREKEINREEVKTRIRRSVHRNRVPRTHRMLSSSYEEEQGRKKKEELKISSKLLLSQESEKKKK